MFRPPNKNKVLNGRSSTVSPSTISTNSNTSTSLSISLPSGAQSPSDNRVNDMITMLQNDLDKRNGSTVSRREVSEINRKEIKTIGKTKADDLVLVHEEMKMIAMETASNSTGYHSDKSSPQSPSQSARGRRPTDNRRPLSYNNNNSFHSSKTKIPLIKKSSRQSLWKTMDLAEN